MFIREKKSADRSYLQIVENRRENGKTRQHVIATLGRLDVLQSSGALDALLCSGSKFSQTLMLLSAYQRGEVSRVATRRVGPALVFERLWQESGCKEVINELLSDRKFEFDVERAVFKTVLHRNTWYSPRCVKDEIPWRRFRSGWQSASAYGASAWLRTGACSATRT